MPQRLLLFTNTANTHPKYFVEYYYLGPDHPQMVQMIDLKPEIRDPTECIDILICQVGVLNTISLSEEYTTNG